MPAPPPPGYALSLETRLTKRRLTDRQTTRIRASQRARADRVGGEEKLDDAELGPEQRGLIIAHFGRQVEVEALEGEDAGRVLRCHLRANMEALVTGDQVVWRAAQNAANGVVVASLPRRSLLARPDVHLLQPKPVAANVDRIVIVIAPEPQPFANLIDRYLIAAESVDITPMLLLNKSDLLDSGDAQRRAEIVALLARYRGIGYQVLTASTRNENGLAELNAEMRDRISVFVGQSGVGKSSLIGALIPGLDIRIGELSTAESKGRHTTTTARLFHLPGGGDLIDSPGIREFGLDHLSRAQIEQGFVEFRRWLGHCRFRDCRHESEPGCAILQAAASGELSAARLDSFRTITSQSD